MSIEIQIENITEKAISLLKNLINTPSISREEQETGDLIFDFLKENNCHPKRHLNNIWAETTNHTKGAPTILLNSHHDTVKPCHGWLTDPFTAVENDRKITGLGSNDAGASAVSLLATFVYLSQQKHLNYKLIVAITAEEEISGKDGIRSLLPKLGNIDLGIVGEPTQMDIAIAEKGLIVLDCIAYGKTGHAARDEGENALYKALDDIHWLRNELELDKKSPTLGMSKVTVTQIKAGTQHNVVPDKCNFVVDIRTNELYKNKEVIRYIKQNIKSEVSPRSYHLNSSKIELTHPIIKKAISLGCKTYGSPTLSDQSMMDFTTMKMGVGDSSRSHTPNEFIYLSEIENGIKTYISLLNKFEF